MGVDAIITLGSMLVPKLFELGKLIFSKKNTPEQTINQLALTNPAALASFLQARANLVQQLKEAFNMDISGMPPKWLVAWRGSIRPAIVTFALLHISLLTLLYGFDSINMIPEWWRANYDVAIGSWLGDRFKI